SVLPQKDINSATMAVYHTHFLIVPFRRFMCLTPSFVHSLLQIT
ncbi:hypothetical protein X975_17877, partial [Stegodyphus mimosarum]